MENFGQIAYDSNSMAYLQAWQWQQQTQLLSQIKFPSGDSPSSSSKHERSTKRSYVQCELWKRQSLVDKVEKEGMTIKDAAKQLGINYSTAKHIMKVFRETGEIETKIMMKRKSKKRSTNDLNQMPDLNFTATDTQIAQPADGITFVNDLNKIHLPVEASMSDAYFKPLPLTLEEKQSVANFFGYGERNNE